MSFSASSRGCSFLGMIVLPLLLLGIVQQTRAEEAKPAENPATISGVCEVGFDYISGFDVEKLSTERSRYERSQDLPTKIYYALGGLASNRSVDRSLDKVNSNQCARIANGMPIADGRICGQGWRCKYAYCNPERDAVKTVKYNVSGRPEEACIIIGKTVGVGESINTKHEAYQEAAKQVALPQDSPQRQQAEKFLTGGESSMSQGVLNNFVDSAQKTNQQELLDLKKKESDAFAKIKAWENSWCPANPWEGGVSGCYEKKQEYAKAKEELSYIEQRRLELAKDAERLKGLEMKIEPSKSPPSDPIKENCSPGAPDCQNISKSPPRDQNNTGFNDAPDPFKKFFLDNSGYEQERRELETACRYGNQAACQRLAGGGYGAYGGYPQQSNRCGSGSQPNFGGGLGGIIGGVISLFSKNSGGNSNCTPDGVPLPQCTLTASPTNISGPGQQVTLSWQSNDAFAATLSSGGSVGVNGSQTVQPQQTTTYTLSLQGYRNTQTGQVLSGQCSTQVVVGGTGTSTGSDPKAQIACSPQGADVGMSVAVSYSCLNSNTSSGSGFSTNSQLSGSATPVVTTPSIGSDTVTYGLTCSKEGKIDSAQCTVKVNKTAIVLVANPKNVKTGAEVNVGWVTSGMQSCTISSPQLSGFTSDNAGDTRVSGIARTPPLTSDATFVLTCTSRSGATKTAEAKVVVSQ